MPVENSVFYEYLNRLLNNFTEIEDEKFGQVEDQRCRFVLALNKMKQYLTHEEDKASIDHITSDYFIPKNPDGSLDYEVFRKRLRSQQNQYVDHLMEVLNQASPVPGINRSYEPNLRFCSDLVEDILKKGSYQDANKKAILSYKGDETDPLEFFQAEKKSLFDACVENHDNRNALYAKNAFKIPQIMNQILGAYGQNWKKRSEFDEDFLNVFTSNAPKMESAQASKTYISAIRPFYDFQQNFLKTSKDPEKQNILFENPDDQKAFNQFGALSDTIDKLKKGLVEIRNIKEGLAPTEKRAVANDPSSPLIASEKYVYMSNGFSALSDHLDESGTKLSDLALSIQTCQTQTAAYIKSKRWSLSRLFSKKAQAHYASAVEANKALQSMVSALNDLKSQKKEDYNLADVTLDKVTAIHCKDAALKILMQRTKNVKEDTSAMLTSYNDLGDNHSKDSERTSIKSEKSENVAKKKLSKNKGN